jgi:hypothetical protein
VTSADNAHFSDSKVNSATGAISRHPETDPDTVDFSSERFAMVAFSFSLPKTSVALAGGMALLSAGFAAAPVAFAAPELSVYITGPEQLQVGLSGT